MFHLPAFSLACFASPSRQARLSSNPGALSRAVLTGTAALAFVAAIVTLPHHPVAVTASAASGIPIMLHAADPSLLRDQAEAMRARLLGTPGVGAVTLAGLHQQRLSVDYTPRHLASFGITPAELADGLPVDRHLSRPGHLALRTDSALDSPQDVVGLPVHTGVRVFRLGDVAMVSRARLDPPVSTLTVEGQPAVQVIVTSTR